MAKDPNPPLYLATLPMDVLAQAANMVGCAPNPKRAPDGPRSYELHHDQMTPTAGEAVLVTRLSPRRTERITREEIRSYIVNHMSDEDAEHWLGLSHTPTNEARPMDKTPLLQTLKTDAADAAWRTAGSQLVKLARDPLVALIARHLAPEDESLRGKVAAFLQTEIGTAMLAGLLSMGLSAVPVENGVRERLARELRVRSLADAGDLVAEVVTGPLRQVMSLYLQGAPEAPVAAAAAAIEPPAARAAAVDPGIKVAVAK